MKKLKGFFSKFERPAKIYILPTAIGCAFGVGLLASLLLATSHSSNYALILCCLMLFFFALVLLETHGNLAGLGVHVPQKVLALESGRGELVARVDNSTQTEKAQIEITYANHREILQRLGSEQATDLRIYFKAEKRGIFLQQTLFIRSRAPVHFFKTWMQVPSRFDLIVAPQPIDHLGTTKSSNERATDRTARLHRAGDEYEDLKPYQTGDSISRVDWKRFARDSQLNTKSFREAHHTSPVIDWRETKVLGPKMKREEQMSFWIVRARAHGGAFTVRFSPHVTREIKNESDLIETFRELLLLDEAS